MKVNLLDSDLVVVLYRFFIQFIIDIHICIQIRHMPVLGRSKLLWMYS